MQILKIDRKVSNKNSSNHGSSEQSNFGNITPLFVYKFG